MRTLQPEPIPTKPDGFDVWVDDLGLFCDCNGEEAFIGIIKHYAPVECVRYLSWDQRAWAALVARARYADITRFTAGVRSGRRVGL